MNTRKKISLALHGAGFVAINTACWPTILGYEYGWSTAVLCLGIVLWIWSDVIEKA